MMDLEQNEVRQILRTEIHSSPQMIIRVIKHVIPVLFVIIGMGCSEVPSYYFSPKSIRANGITYIACEGMVRVYSPSRNIVSSSNTTTTYEVTFTDKFGQQQDLINLTSYSIEKNKGATYALPYPIPGPDALKFLNGKPFKPGDIVLWGKDGNLGRATFNGPGKWEPVPCKNITNFALSK